MQHGGTAESQPLVEIVMAVYNGEQFLREQLDSLLAQSYSNWKLLVSDDNSSDASLEIIKEYVALDSRISLALKDEHFGSAKAHFMRLLGLTSAPYVMCCDQDDVWDADKIELTLARMLKEENKTPDTPLLICTDLRVVDQELNEISPSFLTYSGFKSTKLSFGYFLSTSLVTGCTLMANKPLMNLLVVLPNIENISMHDWWLSLIAAAFGRIVYINKPTISYRQHEDNSVGAIKRSISSSIASFKSLQKAYAETILQVGEFLKIYGGSLDPQKRAQASAYFGLKDARPHKALTLIKKADCLRDDTQSNIGLILTAIAGPIFK